jgi:hypothetical protein
MLREEVSFHCPVIDGDGPICGSPYLTWHHFDPPWRIEHHHRPEGMIALCRQHADEADAGAFTLEQQRQMKAEGLGRGTAVRGRFDWMRRDLLAIVGGSAYHDVPIPVMIGDAKAVWFDRNQHEELLLGFTMPTVSGRPRVSVDQNTWHVPPDNVADIICPPSGRLLRVKYDNGDRFASEFFTVAGRSELEARVPYIDLHRQHFEYPLTVVKLWEDVSATSIHLGPRSTTIGSSTIASGFMRGGHVGIKLDAPQRLIGEATMARVMQQIDPRFRM